MTWAVAGVLVLTGCRGDDDAAIEGSPSPTGIQAAPTTPAETDTASPIETVSHTAGASPTGTRAPNDGATTGQDPARELLVTPQQPVTVAPGDDAEFAFAGRLGDSEADTADLIGFGWLPCDAVDATQTGVLTFPDDGADGPMGTSHSGGARLHSVNGERYENVDDEWPVALHTTDEEPPLDVTMRSDSADCATLVFFLDEDGDEEFDRNEDGTAAEVYGVAEANWER